MTAYIWDLDGTLLDSYGVIVAATAETVRSAGLADDAETILRTIKKTALTAYLKTCAERSGMPFERLLEHYRLLTHEMDGSITLMNGAEEALEALKKRGAEHYVYTHRGESSEPILKRLGILHYFRETVTSVYGLPPKPSGAGVRYLTKKYGLDPEGTWYVGDRPIDILCGKDAGVKAMLLLPEGAPVQPTGMEDRIIRSLWELKEEER